MRLLVTGICGFVGSTLAKCFLEMIEGVEIFGIDSLIRPGSELNRRSLPKYGCKIFYGDVRSRSDLDQLPPVDWVIDAAANPSVSAGVDGSVSSRQLVEHNGIKEPLAGYIIERSRAAAATNSTGSIAQNTNLFVHENNLSLSLVSSSDRCRLASGHAGASHVRS